MEVWGRREGGESRGETWRKIGIKCTVRAHESKRIDCRNEERCVMRESDT